MTIVAGYGPWHQSSGVLELATAVAAARGEDLLVATIVPPRWNVPSMARQVDGEFASWSTEQGEHALARARAEIDAWGLDLEVSYRWDADRSAVSGLQAIAADVGASLIVVGSSEDGRRGRVELGSTSDRLVHSARIPVAVAPRGYDRPADGFTSVTCAVDGRDADAGIIATAAALAREAEVPLRLATFVVRMDTMYPPEVGLNAEDEVAAQAREQAERMLATLRGTLPSSDVEVVVGLGHGWRAAMDSVPWDDDGVLVIGSKPQGPLARVFLGSSATKIVRHSMIPVVILPA